jgi:hypothetical protein
MTTETASPAPAGPALPDLNAFTSVIQTQLDTFIKATNEAVAQMSAVSAAAAQNMQQRAAASALPAPANPGATPTVPAPPSPPATAGQPPPAVTADGLKLLATLQANPALAYMVLALVSAYLQTQATPARG